MVPVLLSERPPTAIPPSRSGSDRNPLRSNNPQEPGSTGTTRPRRSGAVLKAHRRIRRQFHSHRHVRYPPHWTRLLRVLSRHHEDASTPTRTPFSIHHSRPSDRQHLSCPSAFSDVVIHCKSDGLRVPCLSLSPHRQHMDPDPDGSRRIVRSRCSCGMLDSFFLINTRLTRTLFRIATRNSCGWRASGGISGC